MRKGKFTQEQIVRAIRHVGTDTRMDEACRKLSVTNATFDRWKKTYIGLDLYELRKFGALSYNNRLLEELVADLMLDKMVLRHVSEKW